MHKMPKIQESLRSILPNPQRATRNPQTHALSASSIFVPATRNTKLQTHSDP
jgi:hypothetical protein